MQPATGKVRAIHNIRFIGFLPCFCVALQGLRFGPLAGMSLSGYVYAQKR
jgi:hypothetical protein